MNQILYTGGKNKSSSTQKIIIFFAIFIILFAIGLIAIGVNLLNKVEVAEGNTSNNTTTEDPVQEANISIQFSSVLGGVKITITSDTVIKTVNYWWDEETATTIDVEDTEYETTISTKQGSHMLRVDVTDENGTKQSKDQLVIGDSGPNVIITTDTISKYVVKVTDDTQITKIVVTVNDQTEEIEVNDTEYEYTVEIPIGDSIIDVTAYNSNGLSTNQKAKITGFGQ